MSSAPRVSATAASVWTSPRSALERVGAAVGLERGRAARRARSASKLLEVGALGRFEGAAAPGLRRGARAPRGLPWYARARIAASTAKAAASSPAAPGRHQGGPRAVSASPKRPAVTSSRPSRARRGAARRTPRRPRRPRASSARHAAQDGQQRSVHGARGVQVATELAVLVVVAPLRLLLRQPRAVPDHALDQIVRHGRRRSSVHVRRRRQVSAS